MSDKYPSLIKEYKLEALRLAGETELWTAPKIVDTNLIPKWNDMRSVYTRKG